jgi:hypothetical protein
MLAGSFRMLGAPLDDPAIVLLQGIVDAAVSAGVVGPRELLRAGRPDAAVYRYRR